MKWEGASTQNIRGTAREPFEIFTLFGSKMLVINESGEMRKEVYFKIFCLKRLIASCLRTHEVQCRIKTP